MDVDVDVDMCWNPRQGRGNRGAPAENARLFTWSGIYAGMVAKKPKNMHLETYVFLDNMALLCSSVYVLTGVSSRRSG